MAKRSRYIRSIIIHMHVASQNLTHSHVYSYFEKGCGKNVHATIPKDNMGYYQYTVPDTVAVKLTFVAFLQ